jgi:ABC-type polysaccharide/polyol phosphate transport system ATPase subunit
MAPVIQVSNVHKAFAMQAQHALSLKETVLSLLFRQRMPRPPKFQALNGVSFSVNHGEAVAIVGSNGSGKSTILKLITGIMKPDQGTVEVSGRLSPLLELGAGFQPDFTGRENVYLNGAIMGRTRKEMNGLIDRIVAFSEIGEFIDQPVKTYSSGMYSRLGFATAIHVNPDILVIDEVLSVGDQRFQQKCLDHIQGLKERGTTILLVSHSLTTIRQICSRAVWLDRGQVKMDGPVDDVADAYQEHQGISVPAAEPSQPMAVLKVSILNAQREPSTKLVSGQPFHVHFDWRNDTQAPLNWMIRLRRQGDAVAACSTISPESGDANGTFRFAGVLAAWKAGVYEIVIDAARDGRPIRGTSHVVSVTLDSPWRMPGLSQMDGQWLSEPAKTSQPA